MNDKQRAISTTTDGKPADPGLENAGAPKPIDRITGQHGAYWVLTEEERKKGFVRPVRTTYVHVGKQGPRYPLRDLNQSEQEIYEGEGYVKYEEFPKERHPAVGRFWKQSELDNLRNGCGVATTMSRAIAETYAVNPYYYGSTFCVGCRTHLPVSEFQWDDGSLVGS